LEGELPAPGVEQVIDDLLGMMIKMPRPILETSAQIADASSLQTSRSIVAKRPR